MSSYFAGHEHHVFLRQLTYQNTDVFLMCFSMDNPDSLANITKTWLPEVRHYCPKGTTLTGRKLEIRVYRSLKEMKKL